MGEPPFVGAAVEVLSFAPGVPMSGYAGRISGATGTHDELSVRALAVSADGADSIVVVADLTTLSPDQAAQARSRIAAATGVPVGAIAVCVTHTHSAPNPDPRLTFARADAEVWEQVLVAIDSAASRAHARREPAMLGYGTGTAALTANRRSPGGPLDDRIDVLRFDRPDGSPIAVAFAYACHPTIIGPQGTDLSADWPGAARSTVEAAFPGSVALFLQGYCGDHGPPMPGSGVAGAPASATPEEAARCGAEVGRTVVAAARDVTPMPSIVAARSSTWVWHWTERDAVEPPRDATRLILDLVPAWRARLADGPREESLTVTCVRWGDALLVLATGELFGALGLDVRATHDDLHVIPVGYANGSAGYLPYPAAARSGGYETELAHVAYGRPAPVPLEFAEHVLTEAARGA